MRAVAAATLMLLSAIARAEPSPLGLAETLRRVAEVGPDQAVARAQLPIAAAEVRTARMFPNPTIGVNGGRAEPIVAGVADAAPADPRAARGTRARGRPGARADAARDGIIAVAAAARRALAYYSAARADDELAIAQQIEALDAARGARSRPALRRGRRLAAGEAAGAAGRGSRAAGGQRSRGRAARGAGSSWRGWWRCRRRAAAARRCARHRRTDAARRHALCRGANGRIRSCARSRRSASPPRRGRARRAPIGGRC